MAKIILVLTYLFSFLPLLNLIIFKDLYFNINYTENFSLYDNKILPASTPYYIRFPSHFNKQFSFSITTLDKTRNF